MYSIQHVDTKELTKIKVKNQKVIVKWIGHKFIPLKAFDILKEETNGFTEMSRDAQKADQLFMELLKREGISLNQPQKEEEDRIRIKRKALEMKVKVLQLKMRLAS